MSGDLNHSPAWIIQQLLRDLTLGKSSGDWKVFRDHEPQTPDNCITVYNTSGLLQGRLMVSGTAISKYGIQIRIRADEQDKCWAKARAIFHYINTNVYRTSVTVQNSVYRVQNLSPSSDVIRVGYIDDERFVCTLNYNLSVEMTTGDPGTGTAA